MYCKHLRIGKIVNTHGIKGEVRVIPLTDDISRFERLEHAFLDDEKLMKVDIEYVKYHKNFVIVKFKGLDNINDVEKYKDIYMLVDRENAIKLPEDAYFVCDIIGIEVKDINGSNLGAITDVISTGSNDVYVVKKDSGELLVPALKSVVKEIDIDKKIMIVELPEGLVNS